MFRPRLQRACGRSAAGGIALAAAALLLAAGPASAVLYKWVDANGRVTYSDQPPPPNVKAEVVGAPPPPANPVAVRDLASQEADLKKQLQQRADDQKKAAKARADTVQMQQACADARSRLKLFESDLPLTRMTDQGEIVNIDDTMRLRERERAEALVRERCAS